MARIVDNIDDYVGASRAEESRAESCDRIPSMLDMKFYQQGELKRGENTISGVFKTYDGRQVRAIVDFANKKALIHAPLYLSGLHEYDIADFEEYGEARIEDWVSDRIYEKEWERKEREAKRDGGEA